MKNSTKSRQRGSVNIFSIKVISLSIFCMVLVLSSWYYFNFQYGEEQEMKDLTSPIENLAPQSLEKLSQKAFYFGHQSVGDDISEGISKILESNPEIKLKLLKAGSDYLIEPGVFLHEKVGENSKPSLKISDFKSSIDAGIGEKGVLAFLKFCYIDINKDTDVERLFAEYQEVIEDLKKKYPATTFIHFTVPLHTVDNSIIKGSIKKILGRGQFGNNVARNKYNSLLKSSYSDTDPIFDVAYFESISSETGKVSNAWGFDGKKYLSLSEDNSYDGGHLNDKAKVWIAGNLLAFLANLD